MGFNLTEITNKNLVIQGSGNTTADDYSLAIHSVRGNLVKVPFRSQCYVVETGTGGSASLVTTSGYYNEDGSSSGLNLTVPSGINNGIKITIPFYGRAFGIRFRREYACNPLTVSIDGIAYPSVNVTHTYLTNAGLGVTDGESLIVIDDNLSDGLHYAEITLTSDPSTQQTILLYGYLVDERAGYERKSRSNYLIGTNAVPTTATGLPLGNYGPRGIRKIMFVNTAASPITVTIAYNGTTLWIKSIATNDTVDFDPGEKLAVDGFYWTYVASATGVNATILGGA